MTTVINPNVAEFLAVRALAESRSIAWYCAVCGLRRHVGIRLPAPKKCRNCGGTVFGKQPIRT